MSNEVSHAYLPHVPDEKAVREITKVREKAIELAHIIEEVGNPRYKALAKTALEESVMWAVKGHAIPE